MGTIAFSFAQAHGKLGGEFYTRPRVVHVPVEMLENRERCIRERCACRPTASSPPAA